MNTVLDDCKDWPDFLKQIYSQKEHGDSETRSIIKELFKPGRKERTQFEIQKSRTNVDFLKDSNVTPSKTFLFPVLVYPSKGLPLEPIGFNVEVEHGQAPSIRFNPLTGSKEFI